MKLSNQTKTHVIISFTGSHYFINEKDEVRLRTVGGDDNIVINGSVLKGKNIAEILTIKKYYETYPNKKPNINSYGELPKVEPKKYTKQRYIRCIKYVRDGFLRGVSNRNNLKPNQKPILEKMNNAINQAINSNQTEFTVDAKLFGYK
jgi:hypothetical protein